MIVLALGGQGSGKTHWLAGQVRQLLARRHAQGLHPWVFVLDTRCYYSGRAPLAGSTPAGDPHGGRILSRTLGSLVPQGHWYDTPATWLRLTRQTTENRKLGRTFGFHAADAAAVFALGELMMRRRQPAVLAVDELDLLPKQLQMQATAAFKVIQHGRRTPVDVLGTARRPQAIDLAFLSEANRVALFALREGRAHDALRRTGWPGIERIVPQLGALPPRHHFVVEAAPDNMF